MKYVYFISLISFSFCSFSQDSLYYLSSTTGAACQEVEYYNGFLFTGTGSTFRVYDVTQPIPYPVLFEYRYRSFLADFRIKNSFLFIAANNDGVSKWDISNPASPVELYRYEPTETGEAAHDISFYGDTIIVASNKKVVVLYDDGTGLIKTGELGIVAANGFISGGEVKDSLYAFTLGRNGINDGVYIFNLSTMSQVSYYQQTYCDPENVVFGKNNNLLHVMGGTQNYTNPLDASGIFYTLDITNPATPQLVFADTIPGVFLAAISDVSSGQNINDTIYVVTTAAGSPDWIFPQPMTGQIYVYDATNPANTHYLTCLEAGLWSFDITLNNRKAYIASEWYGIKTIDISNIMNETDLGNTVTGGWAEDADKYGNKLVVANEGFGFKLYNISNPLQPVLENVNHDPGFCYRTRFSHDGNYIYTSHQTYDGFRIYNSSNLTTAGSLPNLRCNGRMLVWNNFVISDYEENSVKQLNIVNVSIPSSPVLNQTISMSVNDMVTDQSGYLFIANNDSIFVFDISSGTFIKKASSAFQFALQNATSVCVSNDTIYTYVTWKGLVKYYFNRLQNTISEITFTSLAEGEPQRIACDTRGLYVAYNKYGLFALNKQTLQQFSYFRTGLDLKGFTTQWGITDMSCRDGFILLTEYFGQTSLISADSALASVSIATESENKFSTYAYPNPFSDHTDISILNPENYNLSYKLTDINGKTILSGENSTECQFRIYRNGLNAGTYFYSVYLGKKLAGRGTVFAE